MQAARANILRLLVHNSRKSCNLLERIVAKRKLDTLSLEQGRILLHQRALGLLEDANEVFHGERVQLDADRESALKLGDQIRRLADVKGAGSNKKNMVRPHHPVTRVHGSPFNYGQNVPLYALSRNIRTMAAFAAGDLIYLIQEDDSCILHPINRHSRDLIHINEALLFFLNQVLECLIDLHLPLLGALAEDVGKHVLDIDVHLLHALIGDDFEGREITLASFDFDLTVVEFAFAQLLA